jgi:uncharacterized protein
MPPPVAMTRVPVRPIAEYVLKVASRCNLACDHCYVYGDADKGWLHRPTVMDQATVRAAATRIVEHAVRHDLDRITVTLHGGEPLLVGGAALGRILGELRSVIDPVADLDLHMQSNGLRLSPVVCELLADHDVKVGISLDGDRLANDRHRRFANGAGSHEHVLRALELLRTPPYRAVYGGILCTIDIENDPLRVYEALLREEPPRIDFLLPHATWDQPPPRRNGLPTAYADWLLVIFSRWTADGRPVPVRIFDSVLSLQQGASSGTEAIGPEAVPVAVIETDGSWEQVDSLKTVSEDAPRTGLDVRLHSVDEVAAHAGVIERQAGELCETCRACPVVDTCGGGLYAHRFGRGNGFANPSVYCSDLLHLISRIGRRQRIVARDRQLPAGRHLPEQVGPRSGLADSVLRDLAGGSPSDATLAYLRGLEYALDRALLARVAAATPDGIGRAAWDLLADVDRSSPVAVRAVLSHPFVRVRARRSLITVAHAGTDFRAGVLASVAAAAAMRAGVAVTFEMPLQHGALSLPGLGTLALDVPSSGVVTVSTRPGEFVVHAGYGPERVISTGSGPGSTGSPEGWHPVRTMLEGPHVLLDDTDPYRDCFVHPVTARLTATAVDEWRGTVIRAWEQLRAEAPDLARGLDALVKVVTPLRPTPHRPPRATNTRNAFGAVAVTAAAPALSSAGLGSLLVRQVAYVTVAAVQDICNLVQDDEPRMCVSRLADVFARAAVMELAMARTGAGRHPDRGLSLITEQDTLLDALDVLDGSRGLSPAGRLLLTGLRGQVEGWR